MVFLTAGQAAKECNVSKPTITRAIAKGLLTAIKDDAGVWKITIPDLLAAGFKPGKPSPPDMGVVHSEKQMHHVTEQKYLMQQIEALQSIVKEKERTIGFLEKNVSDLRSSLLMLEAVTPVSETLHGKESSLRTGNKVVKKKWWNRA